MILNGSDLMLFVEKDSKVQSIAYATSHTLEISADTKDTSTKDNGNGIWANSEVGTLSWTTSTENLCADSAENGLNVNDLFELMLSRQKIKVCFGLQSNYQNFDIKDESTFNAPAEGWSVDTANQYTGTAIITSLSINAQNGEKASYSCSLTGAGPLTKVGSGILRVKKN